jgi:predicted RNA binding protein YcfA (HicA-like mRNA interferase family)
LSQLKPYKFRDLIKKFRQLDSRFEVYERRGKGSHRVIYHPDILGKPVSFPLICHGEGQEIDKKIIKNLLRAFNLPDDAL